MIIRPHHVFMLPVDCIVYYCAVCTMGRDESYRTSVFHWFVVCKVSKFDLLRSRCLNAYHPGGGCYHGRNASHSVRYPILRPSACLIGYIDFCGNFDLGLMPLVLVFS